MPTRAHQKSEPRNQKRQPRQSAFVTIAPPEARDDLDVDWLKVMRLRAAIEDGRYAIDTRVLAETLVAHALPSDD